MHDIPGTTKKLNKINMTAIEGPILNKGISPRDGRISSLKSSVVPSAIA
jgi:hypothetical protein